MHTSIDTATGTGPDRSVQTTGWRAELLPRRPYCAAYTPARPVVGFAFEGQAGVHAFAGDRRTGFRVRPNGLAYVPAGCDVYSESETGGEYLRVTFENGRDALSSGNRRFSGAVDPAAIEAAHRLRRMLLAGAIADPLLYEPHVEMLRGRAAAVLTGVVRAPNAAGWMTPRRLRRVDELIDARLASKLTVQDLADALGLSGGFFARAFKAAVGKAPHDHIIDRRISRARTLLRRPGLDLAAVAQASGFASHAHMTATFRARLGVTPGALRRDGGY